MNKFYVICNKLRGKNINELCLIASWTRNDFLYYLHIYKQVTAIHYIMEVNYYMKQRGGYHVKQNYHI